MTLEPHPTASQLYPTRLNNIVDSEALARYERRQTLPRKRECWRE
ncbi:MAG: hypothetical protein AB1589_27845 [Cyanobacteriota bacterium]